MRPPGVLIIVENLPVPFDRRVWMEARTLRDAGYQVSVICPVGKDFTKRNEVLEGINIYRHPLPTEGTGAISYLLEYGTALFWELTLALKISLTHGFDVIHACNPPDLIFLVAAPFKIFGKKFIFDHHDLCPELFEAKFGRKGFFHGVLRLWERATFALADVTIATNESYKRVAVERGRKAPSSVFVVRSGPEREKWTPRQGSRRWVNGRKHLVGYVGVMGEQEGLDLLIDAIEIVVQQRGRQDVQFVLIGDGTARKQLEAQVARSELGDYVSFTGRIPDSELIDALASADVLVNPDRPGDLNDKSTMNKIVEYMALAKPIVQFEMCEGRFSAQDASLYARPGDIADFADAIIQLIDDPALCATMGGLGRERFEQHLCWEKQRPILLAAYAAALGPRKAPEAPEAESVDAPLSRPNRGAEAPS
jgi:glycosyltransferase involved in cell wall biosynthesis